MTTLADFTVSTSGGDALDLSAHAGRVVLVVNTASSCGLTPQFAGLQELHERYEGEGLTVLGFPCGQFAGQEPNDAEGAAAFCRLNYGVDFPMLGKVDVNGAHADPLFRWLKKETGGVLGGAVKWNFTKFLVGRDGRVIQRFAPTTAPARLRDAVEAALHA